MSKTKRGVDVLRDGALSKSIAFSREEREELGLRGLMPYAIGSQEIQLSRVIENIRRKEYDIERYVFLNALQNRNERLYYKLAIEYVDEILPLVYTPTVGQACKEFSHIFRQEKGFYITPEDKGEIRKILDNWPQDDVRIIVITDGQRILGLGDLGANGMGIPIGKSALYTAFAGIPPEQCMPVMLDVGTNNKDIIDDVLYLGYPHPRLKGEAYFELVDEFVQAVQDKYPKALIQFEDFLTPNAYALLSNYQEEVLCFNDDIQGTAAVALAGVYCAGQSIGIPIEEMRIMFLGAGAAATGIADLMVVAKQEAGLSKRQARSHIALVDVNGLIVHKRSDLEPHHFAFARRDPQLQFLEAIQHFKPHVLIGATGVGGTFTQEVIETMSFLNDRPVIFALSNPTSKAECTAEQAFEWSNGRVIFASGSPFGELTYGGKTFRPGQGNNAYIFPGIGLGALAAQCKTIPDLLFLVAAQTLAALVSIDDIQKGSLYPPLKNIRDISKEIAIAVANKSWEEGIATATKPDDLEKYISEIMYDPTY